MMRKRKDPGPQPQRSFTRFLGRVIPGSVAAPHPGFVSPELATLRDRVPTKGPWLFEIKFDGYRLQAHRKDGVPSILTRSGLDWTHKFSYLASAVAMLPARELIMDGELVSLDEHGRPNFSQLQADISAGRQNLMQFYAFDLLYLDGFDFRRAPLIDRKRVLQAFLLEAQPRGILFSEHFEADGEAMYEGACQNGLEGIIAKKADSPYKSTRSEDWLKIKCVMTGNYTIVGYVPGGNGGLGALRVARKDAGHLVYAGKTGTGFTVKSAQQLLAKLKPLAIDKPPLMMPKRKKDTIWVQPKLAAKIEYRDITDEGYLRHSSFKGLA